jgi:hypothetical protein
MAFGPSSDSLIVGVASPRYLLAMKLFATRAERTADPGEGEVPPCRDRGLNARLRTRLCPPGILVGSTGMPTAGAKKS